jgi:Fe-S-cluster containining protein
MIRMTPTNGRHVYSLPAATALSIIGPLGEEGNIARTKMGSVCCEHCTAACCQYLALPLDHPETARDFDDIRWYLMHKGVAVFVEDGEWYIQVPTRCDNLRPDNLCGIYEKRPKICREYKAGDCDYAGGSYGYDQLFLCEEDILAYMKENPVSTNGSGARKKGKTAKAKKSKKNARASR